MFCGHFYHRTALFEEITWNRNLFRRRTTGRWDFEIIRLLQHECLEDIIFMQDGLPPHTDHHVRQSLIQYFPADDFQSAMGNIFLLLNNIVDHGWRHIAQ